MFLGLWCETCIKHIAKPFSRHSISPLAFLGTNLFGTREMFTNIYKENARKTLQYGNSKHEACKNMPYN